MGCSVFIATKYLLRCIHRHICRRLTRWHYRIRRLVKPSGRLLSRLALILRRHLHRRRIHRSLHLSLTYKYKIETLNFTNLKTKMKVPYSDFALRTDFASLDLVQTGFPDFALLASGWALLK